MYTIFSFPKQKKNVKGERKRTPSFECLDELAPKFIETSIRDNLQYDSH